ncbi:MAG: 6-pyruvoyl trahydropterin synthase family protein [Bdellovibrionia bacterium]
MKQVNLHLAKQNFKFSSAHFLIFDAKSAEKLHGHNYRVEVDIEIPITHDFSGQGYFVDFNVFKKYIKAELDIWDEHVLLPAKNKEVLVQENGNSLEVRFRERYYVFPKNEVILLPITNTSVEQLADLLSSKFAREFSRYGVEAVRVSVEETQGQSAMVRAVCQS